MGPAYPPDSKQDFLVRQECIQEHLQEHQDEPPHRDDAFGDDEQGEDITSLLEENARLRGLVVRLTDMILKNVADQG
jgi:hypothetical protein